MTTREKLASARILAFIVGCFAACLAMAIIGLAQQLDLVDGQTAAAQAMACHELPAECKP